jgi:hypothetical protein
MTDDPWRLCNAALELAPDPALVVRTVSFPAPLRLVLIAAFMAVAIARAQDELRFSTSLGQEERTATGLARLDPDRVAVIDALVRRDSSRPAVAGTPADFSARLTADERRTAGIDALTNAERGRLDAAVARHQSARAARSLQAPLVLATPRGRIATEERRPERGMHGAFSLSYTFGRGGYSERTGSILLTHEDPASGLSFAIGYSETHVKGPAPYYLARDPLVPPPTPP